MLFDASSDQLFSVELDAARSSIRSLQENASDNRSGLLQLAEYGLHAPDFAFDA
jgi:hypothetical protein